MKDKLNIKFYKKWWFWLILILIILFAYFMIGDSLKKFNTANLEYELIKNGKTVSAREVVEKVAESLKTKDYEEIKKYLSTNCSFYESNKKYNIETCLASLDEYETYRIEQRKNSTENEETYRIYWNGWNYEETGQIIDLFMTKKVTREKITYEIYSLRFTNNN